MWIDWLIAGLAFAGTGGNQGAVIVGGAAAHQPGAIYTFALTACEGTRARMIDATALGREPIRHVTVILTNPTEQDCTYSALMVAGTLSGGFTTDHRVGDAGFMVPARGTTTLKLFPDQAAKRPLVTLETAPDRTTLLLTAPEPESVPPEIYRPQPVRSAP